MGEPVLKIENLEISLRFSTGEKTAINRLSCELHKGEILGIVGESGCGKSLTSLAVMRLLSDSAARVNGSIWLHDENLMAKSEREMRRIRGKRIAMIFQDPLASLNPAYTIGSQLVETIRSRNRISRKEAANRAIELLQLVGLPSPERRVRQYPHELSGGMRQRVMIALALSSNPEVLIADEPTTALDVTVQAGIVQLLMELRERMGMSIIFISHDFGVVSQIADNVLVMYAGRAVEQSSTSRIFKRPLHPYTQGLLASIPSLADKRDRLAAIEGSVPGLGDLPHGCKFHNRCPYARPLCAEREPELIAADGGKVRCWISTKEWEQDVR